SAQHIAGVLGGFIDEEAEFGTRGLEVRRDAVVLHLRGGGGADGDDDDGTQAADQGGDAVHLLRDHHQVNDLDGGGEEDDIDFSVGDAVDTFAQRFEVVRQRPLIHRHFDNFAGTLCEFGEQFGVGSSILLYGDAEGFELVTEGAVHGGEDLMPGAGLRRGRRRLHLQLAQDLIRLGAAGDDADAAQSIEEFFAVEFGFYGFKQRSHADAGEEEDDVDLAGDESGGKVERVRVGLELDLAHCRHDQRFAAIGADQLLDLFGPARFE